MITEYRIFPECSSDTLLIKLIKGLPVHYAGIGQVFKKLKNNKHPQSVVGVVDNDKFVKKHLFVKELQQLKNESDLLLMQKPDTNQYVIFICPAFEQWIWKCARIGEINTATWGYQKWQDLKRHSKSTSIDTLHQDYKNFINAIVQKNPTPIAKLKEWLNEIL